MLSDHDREFFRQIGVEPYEQPAAVFDNALAARHPAGFSLTAQAVPPIAWAHSTASPEVMSRADAHSFVRAFQAMVRDIMDMDRGRDAGD